MSNNNLENEFSSSAKHKSLGSLENWSKTENGIFGKTENGYFQITICNENVIRVQASKYQKITSNPYSIIPNDSEPEFSIIESKDIISITTSEISLTLTFSPFTCTFFDKNGNVLNQDDPLGISWIGTEVTCYKKVQKDEKFIGLGEKTGNLNRAGQAYINWNTDYFAYGTGDDPLYMSIPFYLGIHENGAYGVYFDNTHKSVFNFGASTNRFMYFSSEDGEMDYYFIHDQDIGAIISKYSDLTGKMQLPPLWSLGFQQCRYSYYPESEVKTLAQTFRDKDIPADVIYLDIHHMEEYKVFTFDGIKFPDPKSLIKHLKSKGFRVVVIMDPGIKADENYKPYLEGKSSGLFVKYPDGEEYQGQVWPGWCAFPDFTNEKTRKWWAEKMEFYTEAGVDGFWTDMNEPASWGQFTPNLIEFDFEGEEVSHRKARNVYGMQMARAAQEGSIFQNKNLRPFVLTRSGFAGVQRYAAAWTGDNVATEEHMLAGVRLVNSLGLSGVPFAGFDVGGFAGEATKSLYARWMSIGAFTPLFRAHSMINSNDAEPWAFGEEVEEICRNYIKLRYKLLPTIYSKFYESSQNGLPINSSLAIAYPQDAKIYQSAYQNQYLFCDTFLVAPVEGTKEITKVYLPKGNWYNLYSDEFLTGGKEIYVDCPLNYLPVFVKGGSVFTMQSDISHTGESHDQVLRVHVYCSEQEGAFLQYEDDGESFQYLENDYFKREISYSPKQMTLSFGPVEGKRKASYKRIRVYLHGFQTDVLSIEGKSQSLKKEDFAFLEKLSEFDPLPEHDHPFYEIKNLSFIEFDHSKEPITISGLF
ncbi:glycoside hydrolase family 31 protein [Algoriphagus zhangzhouensis]|uniref:Alpha-glucosidase n=1 Tax=Algoriphagus zhangzhouensis TaxID=1073327 RepID=A0A1M7Z3K0_9BACT|nr:glycoside hydrolase family 31 protein [Algoriphagus zhangzhouensis]TDY48348.1 alpha-glucosidase [Algoriphagus zhangzhouensis]SHO59395.1 alpha-glucosidase [Algoriphagus zhangzhouensis]